MPLRSLVFIIIIRKSQPFRIEDWNLPFIKKKQSKNNISKGYEIMEAIVLAGGFGTRLKTVIRDVPKPMAPIGGKPFLELLIVSLGRKGFKRVILSVGYLADQIRDYFGSSYRGLTIDYEMEDTPLGTGGAIARSMERCRSDHVFVFNGDTFLDLEVSAVEEQWNNFKRPIIVAIQVSDSSRYGGLDVVGGQVVAFYEKGREGQGLINAGCYVFPADIFKINFCNAPFSIENDFLPEIIKKKRFDCFVSSGQFIDIGTPEDYARACTDLRNI